MQFVLEMCVLKNLKYPYSPKFYCKKLFKEPKNIIDAVIKHIVFTERNLETHGKIESGISYKK